MVHRYEVPRYMDYKERLEWLTETEKLLNNLEALKISAASMSARTQELNNLFKEVEFNLADAHSIKAKLNHTAVSFGLQPLVTSKKD